MAERKKKSHFTDAFIFIMAKLACLATVLTEPLCKLQSEAELGFPLLFSGKGGEEGENRSEVHRQLET